MFDVLIQVVVSSILLLGSFVSAEGERCYRSVDNQTVVYAENCPYLCCDCDGCRADQQDYDGEIWASCGTEQYCLASARGFWWIIATALGSVFAMIIICVLLEKYNWCDDTTYTDVSPAQDVEEFREINEK